MSQEQAFLEHLDANPGDDLTRLVYADWLEDHGDPRGDYLRSEIALASMETHEEDYDQHENELIALRATLDPDWVSRAGKRFDVVLFGFEPWGKLPIIKLHRSLTDAGLRESKDAVEQVAGCLFTALPRGRAEETRDRFRALRPGEIDVVVLPTGYDASHYGVYLSVIYGPWQDSESEQTNREIDDALVHVNQLLAPQAIPLGREYRGPPVMLRDGIDFSQANEIRQAARPHVRINLRRTPPLNSYPPGLPGPYPQERPCRVVLNGFAPKHRDFVEWVLRQLPNSEGLVRSLDSPPVVLADSVLERQAVWMFQRFRGRAEVSVTPLA